MPDWQHTRLAAAACCRHRLQALAAHPTFTNRTEHTVTRHGCDSSMEPLLQRSAGPCHSYLLHKGASMGVAGKVGSTALLLLQAGLLLA